MNIKPLIEASLKGDMEAYRSIVLHFGPSVRAYLCSKINDYHVVEDISQDVFITAYKTLSKYKGKGKFSSWLISIAHNKSIDYIRKHYSQKRNLENYQIEVEEHLTGLEDLQSFSIERIKLLKDCLSKLPQESKQLIIERYMNSETVINLAQRLESTENAISSKLFRLRKKLKDCIEAT